MATTHLSLQPLKPLCSLQAISSFHIYKRSVGLKRRRVTKVEALGLSITRRLELGRSLLSTKSFSFARRSSSSPATLSSTSHEVEAESENGVAMTKSYDQRMEFNRVNCLVWVLHESARSFSLAVESLEPAGSGPALAMAWNGKDIHEWHKHISYQVAVYALLKTAVEVEILLSRDRHNNSSRAKEILTPKINLLEEYIRKKLTTKQPELLNWLREVELPRISGFFIPLLKKWSMEYAGSGVAGIIVAISCYAAVGKLGSQRLQHHLFTSSMEDVLIELMDLSFSLVEVEKLYKLAAEAGFELDFLSHFGAKVLPYDDIEELEFWIGLAHKKLSTAIHKEIMSRFSETCHGMANNLATLGLFAYLGRKTRLFLSKMGINDVDELIKDLLSYLECGSLFIYPQLATVSAYQSFMEAVVDEVGWLEFYPECARSKCEERRRTKPHPTQAEKEMILSSVFTACYDVFSGFARFTRSNQQPLDAELLAFLLRSQSLLTTCMEDYRAVYDRSREPEKMAEKGSSDQILQAETTSLNTQQKPAELMPPGSLKTMSRRAAKLTKEQASSSAGIGAVTFTESSAVRNKLVPVLENFLRRYTGKMVSATSDIWMGTQLLFIDIMDSLELLQKQLRGNRITNRERKRLQRTLSDIVTLIPVTVIMLLPVSAVGHAAMLAALKKYMPCMIPSPFSPSRLDVVKQLKRTKKLEVRLWSNIEDPCPRINNLEDSSRTP